MTTPLDAIVESRISPPAQPVLLEDLALYADPGPSDTEGQSPSIEEMDVGITNDELKQMTMDILAGKPDIRPSSPYAAKVLERLKAEIAALPVGAIVEIPADNP